MSIINVKLSVLQTPFIFKIFSNVNLFVQEHLFSIINISLLVLLIVLIKLLRMEILAHLVRKNVGNVLV